jgi:hypothetical protein
MRKTALVSLSIVLTALNASPARAQRPDPAATVAAQKEAMKSLALLDGVWRGPAWTLLENGQKQEMIQTERIGPFLDGAIRVVEGRGYDAATGAATFNAFAVISYDATQKSYALRTYAQGRSGEFNLTPTANGYIWEILAGPMTIRYTVTIKDGLWNEIGERITPGRDPMRFVELNLKRIGDTDWPAAGVIPRS